MKKIIKEISNLLLENRNITMLSFIKQLDSIKKKEIQNHILFSQGGYQRNLIYRNENFELLLLCWDKGSITPIHHHPKNGCLMKLLQGQLRETLYTDNGEFDHIRNPDYIGYIDDKIALHKIEALEPSISLHLYSPPNFYKN